MEGVNKRTAVILFNLGGPESQATVRPFLYNFFTDPNIITLPWPLRQIIAWMIAKRRSVKEAGSSYSLLGWVSPLLRNTQCQAAALESQLQQAGEGDFKVFISMRYWHPMADAVATEVKAYAPDRIVLLPLYPQYSTTTTKSSLEDWKRAAKKIGLSQPVSALCCYPLNEGFINASIDHIRGPLMEMIAEADAKDFGPPRLLFSAHGLPEKIIATGDPYQDHAERTAKAIAEGLAIPNLDWQICYQSKVGRLAWIGPSTIEALEDAGADGAPVLIYPHAFVSEHVETLVELDIEYRHLAERLSIPLYRRVETVMDDPSFITGLKTMVLEHMDKTGLSPGGQKRVCNKACTRCALTDPALGF